MQREMEEHGTGRVADGLAASQAESAPCQQPDDSSQRAGIEGYSGAYLPENILFHIHSLMPIQYAAQVASVSRAFLRSWRSRPNFAFSNFDEIFGSKVDARPEDERTEDFITRVDHILKNHSGIGLKTVYLQIFSAKHTHFDHIDSWLQIVVTPQIKVLYLDLRLWSEKYNFPCSLLSDRTGQSLQYLFLVSCNFHPGVGLGCLGSLTRLQLKKVHITDGELGCLLSNSFALKQLELEECGTIICLEIPCLPKLSYLRVSSCPSLQVIESKATNLSSLSLSVGLHVQLSLLETSPIKKLDGYCSNFAFYARTELPSNMPDLETLAILSSDEEVDIPMLPSKFLHLKFFTIVLGGNNSSISDYFSLVSFLYASPFLESFTLRVLPLSVKHVSVFEDPSVILRTMPEQRYVELKRVMIISFSSATSMVELVRHILDSTASLEHLTLDTTQGTRRCFDSPVNRSRKCLKARRVRLEEAQSALLAAQTYIKPKVPPRLSSTYWSIAETAILLSS